MFSPSGPVELVFLVDLRAAEVCAIVIFMGVVGSDSIYQIGAGLYAVGRPVQKKEHHPTEEDGQTGTNHSLPLERGALFNRFFGKPAHGPPHVAGGASGPIRGCRDLSTVPTHRRVWIFLSFFETASFNSSFHHHVSPLLLLPFFYPHTSSHAFKIPSMKLPHKFSTTMSTNLITFS